MEYSCITGLSLIFPLKVSRALVSVCLLGHVSGRKWEAGVYPALPVYLDSCLHRSSAPGYQPAMFMFNPGPFSITVLFTFNHSLNANHSWGLGLNRFAAMTNLRSPMIIEMWSGAMSPPRDQGSVDTSDPHLMSHAHPEPAKSGSI